MTPEFSFRTREAAIRRFREERFDLLIIGGGITGAAAARDAASRGLKVALVERHDFAFGTSSRSSKLIHGGLRYLENFEFKLVFEALKERALLLKTAPTMVKPLRFYLPVYDEDPHGRAKLSMGLWLYDLLTLFRTPGFHRGLSRGALLNEIPFLKADGLTGGFSYFDASMWDDVLAIQTLRSASAMGAAVANYAEAISPIWEGEAIRGFKVRDLEAKDGAEIELKAERVVACAGPWLDQLGAKLSGSWKNWLTPSKGVHLIFDLKRIPISGALVMAHPKDGRIAFVIPRPDFGQGVVIVGTTDGPTPASPEDADILTEDVNYLMDLLARYFPSLKLKPSDILSGYVGVRPLMSSGAQSLQKVSREHHIDAGPGGTVIVAGGKYTTHRPMAKEIVDFTLEQWKKDLKAGKARALPASLGPSRTEVPVNPAATPEAIAAAKAEAEAKKMKVADEHWERYGADGIEIYKLDAYRSFPPGFPLVAAQLRYAIQKEMAVHLEDFYFRRLPLYASRSDHSLPWAEMLSQIWAAERGLSEEAAKAELQRLKAEIDKRSAWQKKILQPEQGD